MEGVKRNQVKLLPYNIEWETEYEQVKKEILSIWNTNILNIEHIGSTVINTQQIVNLLTGFY